jgi:1-acyl-sn-glycerol-3-phosphate acyltransferase
MSKEWFYKFCRTLCYIFCRICFRIEFYGKDNIPPNGRPVILASNHASYFDPPCAGICIHDVVIFMARTTLYENKLFGLLIKALLTVPVKRGVFDKQAMKKIVLKLKEGAKVCLFPEGTRTLTGEVGQAKPGIGIIALQAEEVPIVSVYIDGSFKIRSRGAKMINLTKIRVYYDKPFLVKDVIKGKKLKSSEKARMIADEVTKRLKEMEVKYKTN